MPPVYNLLEIVYNSQLSLAGSTAGEDALNEFSLLAIRRAGKRLHCIVILRSSQWDRSWSRTESELMPSIALERCSHILHMGSVGHSLSVK